MAVVLCGFWRSLGAYRVCASLNLKGVPYTETDVVLVKCEQHAPAFQALNPQKALPLLVHDGLHITQSPAIIDYIEETWKQALLLPADSAGRARVRSIAQITIADVHPLIVPRVRELLERDFG